MNPTPIKPMLGVKADMDKLHFPLYASTKLDGVRAIVKDGVVWSRTGKPIRNKYVQHAYARYEGCDGELIVGCPNDLHVYNKTTSLVMSKDVEPTKQNYVMFCIFDRWDKSGGIKERTEGLYEYVQTKAKEYTPEFFETLKLPFEDRIKYLTSHSSEKLCYVTVIQQTLCNALDELKAFEEDKINLGFEGVMVRNPDAPYKHGRSTVKEEGLLKIKRFSDSEAIVINCIEKFHNANEATLDELGYKTHSTRKENLVGMDTLGSLLVEDPKTHVRFNIGSGFSDIERDTYWTYFEMDKALGTHNILGKIVKYKYFTVGMKDAPRFPIFLGFRDPDDM